ncbi:hypothetical protein ACLKMH_17425 [Psychromonas sp. KJ10-10]|uniref:hypothetical protein n=1 Tax=Psychromonas sp. KJ10-10 TaxID=3391823 RepID=UPI0039B4CE60
MGDRIKKERVEKLVPGIETCIKGNKYSVIFICVESKETSVPKAVSVLLSIINGYQADLYIITQVTPVNTMDQLRVISGKVIVTLFDGHAINNMGPEIVIGGTNSAHKLFKSLFNDRFLTNGNFQYTSLVNSEVLHLLCYFKHANQVTSADLIRFSSGLTGEGE